MKKKTEVEQEKVTKPFPITPTGTKLLIQHLPEPEKTEGGIILPPNSTSKVVPIRAKILAAGPGRVDETTGVFIETQCKPGWTIIVNRYMGDKLKYNNEDYLMIRDTDALCRVIED